MNKEELREYFISRKRDFIDIDNLQESLDNISVFSSDNQLDMKSFFSSLTKILSWELINSIPFLIETGQKHEKIVFALNLQAWAFNAWNHGIENANISRIITAYTIIKRLHLNPDIDLNWNIKSNKMIDYLKKILPNINFDVRLDSFPDNISYEDRKFHEVYREALNNKDYNNIIAFLTNNGFIISVQKNPIYFFLEIITKLSISQPILLLENFSKYSPVLINTILKFLDKTQIISLLEEYKDTDTLPLLLGLIIIINPEGNNIYNKNIESDYVLLEKASYIVDKIAKIIKEQNIFNYISDCGNISMNKLWHGIFMFYIGRNIKSSQGYIDSIDFFYNHDRLGEYSYLVYSENCKNDSEFNSFSINVYEKYLQDLKELDHGCFFRFSSYYQFFFYAIRVLSDNSFERYLLLLENKSLELRRVIYSWNHNRLYKYFTDWFYWIISAKMFSRTEPIEKNNLLNTYSLLTDERIFYILNCEVGGQHITFNSLIDFLDEPDSIHSVSLADNETIVNITWQKINS